MIEECIICYNEYDINDGIVFNCKHKVCLECYEKMLNHYEQLSCPICRSIISSRVSISITIDNNMNVNTELVYCNRKNLFILLLLTFILSIVITIMSNNGVFD